MVESPADTLQVADAVAVGVEERARIDLIDDAALPPRAGHRTKSRYTRATIAPIFAA